VEALCALREVDNGTREEETFYRAEEVDAMIRVSVYYRPRMPQTGCQGYRENNDGS
jgi:hypothetical protein